METIITSEGDMVDQLAYRHYGTHEGTTAAILEANPGLAAMGPVLPAGVEIKLPVIERPVPEITVKLYD
jgi:phage tail protein X